MGTVPLDVLCKLQFNWVVVLSTLVMLLKRGNFDFPVAVVDLAGVAFGVAFGDDVDFAAGDGVGVGYGVGS